MHDSQVNTETIDPPPNSQPENGDENRYRLLFSSQPNGICILDADGRFTDINPAAEIILGVTRHALLHQTCAALSADWLRSDGSPLLPGEHPAHIAASTGHAVRGVVVGLYRAMGVPGWIRIDAVPTLLGGDTRPSVVCSLTDVTDSHQSEARIRAIYDRTFQFIGLLSPDGTMLEANASSLRAIGRDAKEVLGRKFWDTPWWEHSATERARLKSGIALAAGGEFVRFETSHPTDGGIIWIDFSLSPVFDHAGAVEWIIPEGRDVTQRKQNEIELTEAKVAAEASNQSKSQFLATMSHELRTPLNAILGYSELVLEEAFGPIGNSNYSGYLTSIHDAGMRLLTVIQDILEISRIETGNADLQPEPLALEDLAQKIYDLVAHHAENKHLTLEFDIGRQSETFIADRKRIIQILVNLLINAVKFTEPGGRIGLAAEQTPQGTCFTIWDTGIGIADEHLPRIWEPFGQVEGALARKSGGIGLGLTLVRHLTEAQGGSISVESQPGQGTRFVLAFPALSPGVS